MKKIILIMILVIVALLLSGCGKNVDTSPQPTVTETATAAPSPSASPSMAPSEELLSVEEYYPFEADTMRHYEGSGNEYASYSVYTDYINENRVQLRIDNGGTVAAKVIQIKDGKLEMLMQRGECYYRENFITQTFGEGEILLMEPVAVGTKWTLSDKRERYISNVNVPITTAAGNYTAIEVTTEGPSDKTVDYYAPGAGLVKSVFTSGSTVVTSSLASMEKGVPLVQTIRFFYPNIDEDKLYYTDKRISFKTNDITRIALQNILKEPPNADLGKVLSENAKLNSLYINKDGMVYADFSKELVSEMNAGSGYEAMLLQCITNTLGTYYGAEKVYITVDNEPYSSGHIDKNKGEAFIVDLSKSVPLG